MIEYAKIWLEAGWLNPEDIIVFEKYGYYSKPLTLRDGREFGTTRIIALNTNSCYYMNFSILRTKFDPGD